MLNNKVAIITGGTRGIGFAIAQTFLKNGAKVAVLGSRKETVDNALSKLKSENSSWEVMGLYPDLTDYSAVEAAFKTISEKFGGIDILVNNAGISAREPIEAYEPDAFKKIMDLNVTAVFNGCKAAVPFMKEKGGSIINTSSMVAKFGQQSGVGYPASKFAVNGLTQSLARELGKYNIRVNAVAPGVTRTDMVAALPEEMVARVAAGRPLGRVGEPEEVANAFLFLASDMASYISGAILAVDGA
ncbi:MAG: SDR family oxidoreductase, partial [Oscillospiraceae bacterium]|nr:SDR family oxidoreductase [Oscillospiraceae bacterium]